MQIVIPMSGFGERFRAAGYRVPKPLIEVDGKPIIQHVVELFPGETKLTFICNQDHLDEPGYRMREILEGLCPTGQILGIAPHKLGPVHAVMQVLEHLDLDEPTLVNYCDFTNWWVWDDFKAFVKETDCDGALPAYRGFHPHSLRGGVYAFIREQDGWAFDIREKQPFTDRPMDEFASTGTYYFRDGHTMRDAMQKCMDQALEVRGEFYVSLAYKPLMAEQRKVAVYEIQHFMQWGTPADLDDYLVYSRMFERLAQPARKAQHPGSTLIPAVGAGSRFAERGYSLPKPLVEVSGRPMILQAASDLPEAERRVFVLRRDLPHADAIADAIEADDVKNAVVWLERLTDGQARTCAEALHAVDADAPVSIGACDNGMLYDPENFERVFGADDTDVVVWGFRGHPDAARRPQMFGWIDADDAGHVRGVSVKKPLPEGNPARDPIIVGAFSFKRASDFARCFERLAKRDGRVNGELYVDSLLSDAVEIGLKVRLFEIDSYPGWGTPDDLSVFEYWQSCFHKWPSHPYRLERDRHVPAECRDALARRFENAQPARPGKGFPSLAATRT